MSSSHATARLRRWVIKVLQADQPCEQCPLETPKQGTVSVPSLSGCSAVPSSWLSAMLSARLTYPKRLCCVRSLLERDSHACVAGGDNQEAANGLFALPFMRRALERQKAAAQASPDLPQPAPTPPVMSMHDGRLCPCLVCLGLKELLKCLQSTVFTCMLCCP